MNRRLYEILKENNYKISIAESCTGGMAASYLVDIENASSVFEEGIVSYSVESKKRYFGIDDELIKTSGFASEKITYQMVKELIKKTNTKIGLAISGYAEADKEVAIAYYLNGKIITEKIINKDFSRNEIRKQVVNHAFSRLCDLIEKGL